MTKSGTGGGVANVPVLQVEAVPVHHGPGYPTGKPGRAIPVRRVGSDVKPGELRIHAEFSRKYYKSCFWSSSILRFIIFISAEVCGFSADRISTGDRGIVPRGKDPHGPLGVLGVVG